MTTEQTPQREDWSLPVFGMIVMACVGALLLLNGTRELVPLFFYDEAPCMVLDKRIAEFPSRRAGNSTYRPEFLIRYEVDGHQHETWAYDGTRSSTALRWPKERILEAFTVGEEYPCWYDPDDPTQVVVVRGFGTITWVLLFIFATLGYFTARGVLWRMRPVQI